MAMAMAYTLSHFTSHLQLFWFHLISILSSITILKFLKPFLIVKSQNPKLPPGPNPWPIVGQLPEMLINKPVFKWIHNLMQELNTEIACIRFGNTHVIPVTCPTIAREFLRKNDASFASRPISISTQLVTKGYLTIALVPFGEQWKKMKKVLVNEFLSPKRHQWLQDKRDEEANNLMFYVYNNGLVNVRVLARHYCGNVIRKMIFNTRYFGKGRNDGGPGFEEVEYMDAIFTLLRYIYAFSVSDYVPWLRGLDLDGHESKLKEAMRIVNKYHDPLIDERIKQWNDGSKSEVEDLLDVLISLKDANNVPLLTPEEIKAQIIEVMIEVVDNPSNAFEWALAEMINQPELLHKATEELDKVVGRNRLVQESDIPNLKFVKACAREAFRLHPIVPFNVPHVSLKDTVVANYFIPKGSHVLLSRLGLGRNPKVWVDEPNKFKPQRHMNDDVVVLTEPDLRFISFSTGRRGCPGVVLGSTMTMMLFARMLHGFTWTPPNNVSCINLAESTSGEMFLDQPLLAIAKPRLAPEMYN